MNKISLQTLLKEVAKFRKERDWEKFNDPKDFAIATSLEASELLEHFHWKDKKEFSLYFKKYKEDVEDELIDVLFNVLLLVHELNINIDKAFYRKLEKNRQKYPVEKYKNKRSFDVEFNK